MMKTAPRFLTLLLLSTSLSYAALDPDVIDDHYIVSLNPGATTKSVIQAYGINPKFTYKKAINGFAAQLDPDTYEQLRTDSRVIIIEQDRVVHANELMDERAVTWGIDRIDQRTLPLDGDYKFNNNGTGVTAYVIDTGIRLDHQEFAGRASFGFDSFGGTGNDCNGHGTHVAGTIGGTNYGVAKNVKLKAVKVLDCNGSGSTSGVIAGVEWVMNNRTLPAVANMSLGMNGISTVMDTAVMNMISAGVPTAVAAGNSNVDACGASPARATTAMTVGATKNTDARSSFSNYGTCVDWFAPGENIDSAWITDPASTRTLSGTSMASPHTAGVAALYLQTHPTASPADVREALFSFTTKGVVTGSNTTNNHMLYSFETSTNPNPNPNPPVDTTNPVVNLISPLQNSSWSRLSYVPLSTVASDNVKVAFVRFYVNNSSVCTDYTAPFACTWRMPLFAASSYTVRATAHDSSGNVGTSQVITIRRR